VTRSCRNHFPCEIDSLVGGGRVGFVTLSYYYFAAANGLYRFSKDGASNTPLSTLNVMPLTSLQILGPKENDRIEESLCWQKDGLQYQQR
jgi:hypothetical protein